jgi:hypothetical protein
MNCNTDMVLGSMLAMPSQGKGQKSQFSHH